MLEQRVSARLVSEPGRFGESSRYYVKSELGRRCVLCDDAALQSDQILDVVWLSREDGACQMRRRKRCAWGKGRVRAYLQPLDWSAILRHRLRVGNEPSHVIIDCLDVVRQKVWVPDIMFHFKKTSSLIRSHNMHHD